MHLDQAHPMCLQIQEFLESKPDYNILCDMADTLPMEHINEMPDTLQSMFRDALRRSLLLQYWHGTDLTSLQRRDGG